MLISHFLSLRHCTSIQSIATSSQVSHSILHYIATPGKISSFHFFPNVGTFENTQDMFDENPQRTINHTDNPNASNAAND
ncbi:hypothetical protein COP2_030798 [Malus domestica]